MRKNVWIPCAFALCAVAVAGIEIATAQQANMVQAHIGHVRESFPGTPDKQGLLPAGLAEAKIAATHASLAMKAPDNLDALKLHAGHVIHAVDPTVEPKGPGLGFGVKRAAQGVAQHIEMAAKTEGASANVKTHATHVAAAANSTAKRADEVVALAQKVRSATAAPEAAAAMKEVNAAVERLTAGQDANGDGRVNWDVPEGGLNQAQQHMELMQKGEAAKP
jgi:hypothetical protein